MRKILAAAAATMLIAVLAPAGATAQSAGQPKRQVPVEIELRSRSFTPKPGLERDAIVDAARSAAARSLAPGDGEAVHFLVQFDELPSAASRRAVEAARVDLLASLGGGAYVASAPVDDLDRVRHLPGFRWAGPLLADDKVDPALASGGDVGWARADDGRIALTVQVHPDVSLESAVDIAAQHGGEVVGGTPLPSVTALFEPEAARALAEDDRVQYVAPIDPPLEEHNDGAVAGIGAGPLAAAPYGLTGAGTTVMVYDSGLADPTHTDFAGRVTQTDPDTGNPNPVTVRSHSTHVAGTVLGSGANSNGNDSAGTPNGGTANQWAGVAPGANLATYGSQGNNPSADVLYDDPGNINADVTTAIAGGIDLTTMSLGNNTGDNGFPCAQLGDYTNTSILLDDIVRGSIGGQQLIYLESAGNERNDACAPANGFSTISSPAGAKNTIVVGAVNSNDDSMTDFSSWGPVDDGRLRPDVVAPGCQSTGDDGLTSTDFVDTDTDGIFDAGEPTNAYSVKCGTSMATPATAGVVALLVEQWRNQGQPGLRPLPHTVKALLAHTAVDLGDPGPDYSNGFGRVDARAAVDHLRADASADLIRVDQVDQGDQDTWQFTSDGAAPLRVTMAWSDPSATRLSTAQLVNDLDLVVEAPDGVVHRPLVLDPTQPGNNATEGTDTTNVIEMVAGHAAAGTWTVRVNGTTVPTGPQEYTLVVPGQASTTLCTTPVPGAPIAGTNLILAQPGIDTTGSPGADTIYGTGGVDRITGLGGNDIVFGLGGNDQVVGGDGDDTLCGGAGGDRLVGSGGGDLLSGDDGNDDLTGSAGDDHLLGGVGVDRLSGTTGSDICVAGGSPGDAAAPPPNCDTIV